jgi:hypothetical protein
MNAEQKLQYLLETVVTRKPADASKNDTAWATGARGLRDFDPGPEGWDGMLAAIRELGYGSVADQLVNGMDFGDPKTQQMILQLGQVKPEVFTAERVVILQSWGQISQPRWQVEGYAAEPTLESVQEELDRAEKQSLIDAGRTTINSRTTRINAWLDDVDMSLSMEEIEAYIADLLSSEDGNPSGGGE